jgi:uncharacterized Fe-S cluster protein YjdI
MKSFEQTRFLIGIPYGSEYVPVQFAESLFKMDKPPNHDVVFLGQTITSAARNLIAAKALKENFDYVFFLDSDMIVPPDIIKRLWSHDKLIVSGLYRARRGIGNYFAFNYNEETKLFSNSRCINFAEELLKIDGLGTGCLLINCDVFKQLSKPWFFYDDGSDVNIEAVNKIIDQNNMFSGSYSVKIENVDRDKFSTTGYGRGEDLNFFKKCYEAKIDCYIDTSLFCGHVGTQIYGDINLKLIRENKTST